MTDADQDLLLNILNRAIGWRVTMVRLEAGVAPVKLDELERIREGLLAMAEPTAEQNQSLVADQEELKP